MKKQQVTILLFAAFVLIWGLVGMRIYNAFNDENGGSQRRNKKRNAIVFDTALLVNSDSLYLSYSDPFLRKVRRYSTSSTNKKTSANNQKVTSNSKKNTKTQKPAEPVVRLGDVRYLGIVENEGDSEVIALVVVNNRYEFLKAGQTYQDRLLKTIWADSVKIIYKEKEFTINKSK